MLDTVFVNQVWVAIGVWVLLYCSDYTLTLVCAHWYRSGVDKHFVFKHLELTPYYQKDIAELRKFSPRFLVMLGLSCGAIWVVWSLQIWAVDVFSWWPEFLPNIYRFILGAFVLMEMAVHVRHCQNLVLFAYARHSRGVQGQVIYSAWLSYRSSAIQLVSFAIVFLLSYLLTSNWFFIGGTFKCLVEAANHWKLSGRETEASEVSAQAGTVNSVSDQEVGPAGNNG